MQRRIQKYPTEASQSPLEESHRLNPEAQPFEVPKGSYRTPLGVRCDNRSAHNALSFQPLLPPEVPQHILYLPSSLFDEPQTSNLTEPPPTVDHAKLFFAYVVPGVNASVLSWLVHQVCGVKVKNVECVFRRPALCFYGYVESSVEASEVIHKMHRRVLFASIHEVRVFTSLQPNTLVVERADLAHFHTAVAPPQPQPQTAIEGQGYNYYLDALALSQHRTYLEGRCSFLPYFLAPSTVWASLQSRAPKTRATIGVFFGQIASGTCPSLLQWIVHEISGIPLCDVWKLHCYGCFHAAVRTTEDRDQIILTMHKKLLFDVGGVWVAGDSVQGLALSSFVANERKKVIPQVRVPRDTMVVQPWECQYAT